MIALAEAARGIYGAWRLAHLDPGGHRWFDLTPEGVIRSFWAMAIAAPAFLLTASLRLAVAIDPDSAEAAMLAAPDPVRVMVVESIAFVVAWTAFPLIAHRLCALVDRAPRFGALVVATNWGNVLSSWVYAATLLVALGGVLPDALARGLGLGAVALMLAYQGYVVKTAIEIGWGAALGFVLSDVTIGVVVSSAALMVERG